MSAFDKGYETQDEEKTPTTSPRRGKSPAPFCNTIKPKGKVASISAEEGAPPAIKKLLEAWLTDTLFSVMSKQVPCTIVEAPRIHATQHKSGKDDKLNLLASGNTHKTANSAGDNTLAAVL